MSAGKHKEFIDRVRTLEGIITHQKIYDTTEKTGKHHPQALKTYRKVSTRLRKSREGGKRDLREAQWGIGDCPKQSYQIAITAKPTNACFHSPKTPPPTPDLSEVELRVLEHIMAIYQENEAIAKAHRMSTIREVMVGHAREQKTRQEWKSCSSHFFRTPGEQRLIESREERRSKSLQEETSVNPLEPESP